jgi:mannose-6-phosphate isomerase-like protein (cupin superfamily)
MSDDGTVRVTREAQVMGALAAEGHAPTCRSNEPGERCIAHRHDHDRVLVVACGEITFGLPEIHRSVRLMPGDRLDLPAGTLHDAAVGRDGVTCAEAQLCPGTLDAMPFHRPGWAPFES